MGYMLVSWSLGILVDSKLLQGAIYSMKS